MELLCGVPRIPKGNAWNNWAAGGGGGNNAAHGSCKDDKMIKSCLSRSNSARGDDLSKLFGVGYIRPKRSTMSGSIRSTRSAGAAVSYGVNKSNILSDPGRPSSINRHIIPPSSTQANSTSHESYSTPLTVIDSYTEFNSLPLRRSQTLPSSAIKRSSERTSNDRVYQKIYAKNNSLLNKENVREFNEENQSTDQYAIPDAKAHHTLPFMPVKRKANCIAAEEGPYDISSCKDNISSSSSSDPLEFLEENPRWNCMNSLESQSTSAASDACYQEVSYGRSNSNHTASSASETYNVPSNVSIMSDTPSYNLQHPHRMCKRHSLASTTSSTTSSRLTSLLGDDTLYSGSSISETGSSISSFGTDEGVYSASSVTASSVYSYSGGSEGDEACVRCQHEAEFSAAGVGRFQCRRAKSVRSARQLPVTQTLRKLLQMVMYFRVNELTSYSMLRK